MKFMKLGSRPDTFCATEAVRSIASEVSSDLIIQVKGHKYLLHKYPLLSKCLRLQKLFSHSQDDSHPKSIHLTDFPTGPEAFELCAKFCYGITITISAYNILPIRCAAEYLQMTEDAEKGNLIYKLDVFFDSCILHGWRDSILALQTTKAFHLWSEKLGITTRCIESIATKVVAHPSKPSILQNSSSRRRDGGVHRHKATTSTNKGWWGEDLAELEIDLYWRTMVAIKSVGKVPDKLFGDALRAYAARWLPDMSTFLIVKKQAESNGDDITSRHRMVLESIVGLLPAEKGSVSCSFLLKLLKVTNMVKACSSSKTELATRIALQLEEATVGDLLVPRWLSLSTNGMVVYDIEIVITILELFMSQGQTPPTSPPRNKKSIQRRRSRSAEGINMELHDSRRRRSSASHSHSSKLKVAKLVDGYLQEIAKDKNLPLSKFISVAESIPGFARLDHDDLYKAIDIYLKMHPNLNKNERKRLCRILDCKRLSLEACMHAAQNEMLPLRVVVQVLFFEQARVTKAGNKVTELPDNIKELLARRKIIDPSMPKSSFSTNATALTEDQWSIPGPKSPNSNISSLKLKLAEDQDIDKSSKSMTPNRPKTILSKLWPVSRRADEKK